MNKAKGNMYPGISDTHNAVKGKCPHGCSYCYMNKLYKRRLIKPQETYLDMKMLDANLGKGKFIFIGNSCDMWADSVPDLFIYEALKQANKFPENKYLFQSKNPIRFLQFSDALPQNCCTGATIETNRIYPCMGNTPPPEDRAMAIDCKPAGECFIAIEPILDFDLDDFKALLSNAAPDYIYIGADSGNNHLPEPAKEKILELIAELEKFTTVVKKKNLGRLTA